MKKSLAALAALAFVLVLLVKPFKFMEVYSTHVGHTLHTLTADVEDKQIALDDPEEIHSEDQHVLIELRNASLEASSFSTKVWSYSLLTLAGAIVVLTLNKRKRNKKKANKAKS